MKWLTGLRVVLIVADTPDPAIVGRAWSGEILHVDSRVGETRPEAALVTLDEPLPSGISTAWLFRRNRPRLLSSDFAYVVPRTAADRDIETVDVLKETIFIAEVRQQR